jgi:hypothetical protein
MGLERMEERGGSQLLGNPWVAIHIHDGAVEVEDDNGTILITMLHQHHQHRNDPRAEKHTQRDRETAQLNKLMSCVTINFSFDTCVTNLSHAHQTIRFLSMFILSAPSQNRAGRL